MPFDRDHMKAQAAALAAKGVFIGTSSWKYECLFAVGLGEFVMRSDRLGRELCSLSPLKDPKMD